MKTFSITLIAIALSSAVSTVQAKPVEQAAVTDAGNAPLQIWGSSTKKCSGRACIIIRF